MAIFVIFPSIHNPSKFLITRFFLNFDNFPIYHLSSFLESRQFLITAILIIFLPPLDAIILSFFLSFFEISYKFFPSPSPSPFFDPRNFTRDRSLPPTSWTGKNPVLQIHVNNENTFRSLYSKKKEEEISNSLLVIPPRTKPFIFPGKYDVKTFRPSLDYNPKTALIMKLTLSLPLCREERKKRERFEGLRAFVKGGCSKFPDL